MKIRVVIPTIQGREEYLERCLRGYGTHTDMKDLDIQIIQDAPSCGVAWQAGAFGSFDYLHFTSDDIVPGPGWHLPMIEACERGNVPVAGVLNHFEVDATNMPTFNPEEKPSFYEDQGYVPKDWDRAPQNPSYYPSIPFCSVEQWREIGPMIASHYGTDKWFGLRAKLAGYWPVVRPRARFYHYTAVAGRKPAHEGWQNLDRLNFDLNVAFPLYCQGKLAWHEVHPAYGTPEGLNLARAWARQHTPPPYYWEKPSDVPPSLPAA